MSNLPSVGHIQVHKYMIYSIYLCGQSTSPARKYQFQKLIQCLVSWWSTKVSQNAIWIAAGCYRTVRVIWIFLPWHWVSPPYSHSYNIKVLILKQLKVHCFLILASPFSDCLDCSHIQPETAKPSSRLPPEEVSGAKNICGRCSQ